MIATIRKTKGPGMNDNKSKHIKMLEAFAEALGNSEDQEPHEIMEELHSNFDDIDGKLDRLLKAQQDISASSKRKRLDHARRKRTEAEKEGSNIFGKFQGWSREQILQRINDLIHSEMPQAAAAYRDLENMGNKEIESILEDLELIARKKEEEKGNDQQD